MAEQKLKPYSRSILNIPFCNEVGITTDMLSDPSSEFPELEGLATNGIMLDLLRVQEYKRLPCAVLIEWTAKLFPGHDIPSIWTLRKNLASLKNKKQRLQKSKLYSADLTNFYKQEYSLPSRRKSGGKTMHSTIIESSKNIAAQNDIVVEALKIANYSLAKEASEWKEKFSETDKTLQTCQEVITRYNPHNAKRREKRKNEKIVCQAKIISGLEKEMHTMQNKLFKNSQSKVKYYKEKCTQLKSDLDCQVSNDDDKYLELEEKLKNEQLKNRSLLEENAILQDRIKELESQTITLYEDGKYNDKTRECVMELLSLNVSIMKIEKVMRSVLKLAGIHPNRVPKHTTINSILSEAHALAQIQLAESLPDKEYTTLHSDGTSKCGHKYNSFQVATEYGTYTLGVREVASGTSQIQLETLEEILQEISEVSTTTDAGRRILANIKCTMSDRANGQKCFNDMLAEYRASILPEVVREWGSISETEKEAMSSLYNFFCGMHFIVGMADYSSEALRLFEDAILDSGTKCESGTVRLIRTACKAFEKRGNEKSGCGLPFATYLHQHGITRNPLIHFRGNRFNVVFANAARIFYLKDKMLDFLKVWGVQNQLLKAVENDLHNEHYIAGCKSLGLIDKLITGPLWRLLESSVHILDMSHHYQNLLGFFQECSIDPSNFMTGELVPFQQVEIKKDDLWTALMSDTAFDSLVQQQLQAIFHTLSLLAERMLSDHLENGKWHKPNEELRKTTTSVAKTNTISERDFGQLDRLLREKPHAGQICLEAHILFTNNKTADWMYQKPEEEKTELLKTARKMASNHKKRFRERIEKITMERIAILQKRKEELERKERKALQEKEKLTTAIVIQGLWQSVHDVDDQLSVLKSETTKRKALQTQLKFRRIVLDQKYHDNEVFSFSKKGIGQFNSTKLRSNLLKLLHFSERASSEYHDIANLINKRVDHTFMEDGKQVVYRGKVVSQVSGFPSWYNIVYVCEPQTVYTYRLEDDLLNGDLKIIA